MRHLPRECSTDGGRKGGGPDGPHSPLHSPCLAPLMNVPLRAKLKVGNNYGRAVKFWLRMTATDRP